MYLARTQVATVADARGLAVMASPGGGPFNTAQAVRLTASDPAATIYFTTDGTTPTTASPQYTGTPITIDATTTLQYMAVDAQGTQSPVGTQTYTIDTVPPVISLTGKPTNPTNNVNPSFTFASNKAGTRFACSLALGTAADAFTACSSPKSYSGLADGSYTFKVRGRDPAGNVSVTPYAFVIDTTAGAPVAQLSPASLNFGSVKRPATSAPQQVTLTNTGTADLTIASIAIGGANPGDFAIAAKTAKPCGTTLHPTESCTVDVTFTPTARKTRSATLAITDNAAGSPHSVALTGTGL
jgi:Chitobiase/beta-hexosaminidase C-terminal domain/Abnormal spindle-like microcephaly-assoc'd, ASPM-SPD-2-Hydin/Bacterial Ig-like domain